MTRREVVRATAEHADYLVEHMRQADRDECWAWAHLTPREAVDMSMVSRDTIAGLADGRVVCIFGVREASPLSRTAYPWMLCTDELPKHALSFLRGSRVYVGMLRERYERLENYVDVRNHDAIKWLGWLGFSLDDPAPFGVEQLPFRRFWMES